MRVVLALLVSGVLLVGVITAVVATERSASGRDRTSSQCASFPSRTDPEVPRISAALKNLPSVITPDRSFDATVIVSLGHTPPPVTVNLVGGDSAELFLLDKDGRVVGSGNFAYLAVGPIPRTIDGRGLSMYATGGAYRCVDLNDPGADLSEPLPPGDYRVEGVVRTDAGHVVTPTVPVRVQ